MELVEVDYEALPVNVDPLKAMDPDAPVIREDIKDKKEGAHGPRKHPNHIFTWEAGDKAAADAAFDKAEVKIKEFIQYPRVHPCPLETCQCVASFDKIKGELTLWGTFQAPHVIRTVGSLISKIPEHKIHVIAPDIGGGFGNKVGAYSGYICAIVASIVTGRPVKWVEDRIENLSTTAFARDFHMTAEIAATKDGRITGLRVYTIADHGAFDACANATKWPAGLFSHRVGLLRLPGGLLPGRRRLHQQGAGRRRLSLLVPGDGGGLLHRARHGHHGAEARHGSGRVPHEEPHQARSSSPTPRRSAGNTIPATTRPPCRRRWTSVGYKTLRAEQKAKQEAFKRGETRELMGIGVAFFTEIVGAGPSRDCDILGIAMFDSAEIRIHPTGTGICRLGTKSQGRGTRPPTPRSSRPSSASPPTASPWRRATPTPRPTASAPTARARRRSRAPPPPWPAARSRRRRR